MNTLSRKSAPFKAAIALAICMLGAGLSAPSRAQDKDVIHLLVPFPTGGQGDSVARFIGNELATRMKRTVVVENKAGANTIIAAQALAKAPADGTYIMVASDATLVANQSLYTKLPYNQSDFVAISQIVELPLVLVASTTTKPSTVKELIVAAKAEPGKYSYASIGVGSTQQLGMEMFASMAGVKLNHIPYKGGGPAMTDLAGGHVNYFLSGLSTAATFIQSGKVKAIGLTGDQRSDLLPGVPTIAEAGVPGFKMGAWLGVIAPAKTPAAVVKEYEGHLKNIANDPALQGKWKQLGGIPIGSSSTEFQAFIKRDTAVWAKIISQAGIKAE